MPWNVKTSRTFRIGDTISCGSVANVDTYDAASRLALRSIFSFDPDCGIEGPLTRTWAYDAEDHTINQAFTNGQWGPTGKLYRVTGNGDYSLHYDGDNLLFVTDATGALVDLKVGALADLLSGNQFSVWDRDTAGMAVDGHNGSTYGGILFGTRTFGPFRGGEGPGSITSAQTALVTFPGSGPCSPGALCGAVPAGGPFPYKRLEGFSWFGITVQGARAVDDTNGQWTTPDAYAGDVHDPMSQKPFAWDGNNPYEYADPSGFAINWVGTEDQQKTAQDNYQAAIDYLGDHGALDAVQLLKDLRDDPSFTVNVTVTTLGKEGRDITATDGVIVNVSWDARQGLKLDNGTGVQSAALGLVHEASHATRAAKDPKGYGKDSAASDPRHGNMDDLRVISGIEFRTELLLDEPIRWDHGRAPCTTASVSSTKC
jgi:hypothetical protein